MTNRARPRVSIAAVVLMIAVPASASARSWIESARDDVLCLRLASPAERSELVSELPADASVRAWLTELPSTATARWAHYQLALGSLAFFADRTDDQTLREGLLIELGVLARRDTLAGATLRAQLERCAVSNLLDVELERGDVERLRELARVLASRYAGPIPTFGADDLPLVQALRTAALAGDQAAVAALLEVAGRRAGSLARGAPFRASRLYAAMAAAEEGTGDTARALADAGHSDALTGPVGADGWRAWQNFPVRFDIAERQGHTEVAARLADGFERAFPLPARADPSDPRPADPELEYAVYRRLVELALARGEPELAASWLSMARRALSGGRAGSMPLPAFRRGLQAIEQLAHRLTAARCAGWKTRPAEAERELATTFRPLVSQMMSMSNEVPLGAERGHRLLQEQIDARLDELAHLAEALPAARAEIADIGFRLFELRAFDQTAPAAAARYLARAPDPRLRQDAERLLAYQASPSLGFRNLWSGLHAYTAAAPEQAAATTQALVALDVYNNEAGRGRLDYLRTLLVRDPELGLLLTGAVWHLSAFQKLLRPAEGMMVAEPTPVGTFAWAIRPDGVSFARIETDQAATDERVRRLRASLSAAEGEVCLEVPPFEAAVAYEIFRDTLGSFEDRFPSGVHLFWYAGGSLSAVPPALLLRRAPPHEKISAAAELRGLAWLGDRYAFSVLPDPALLVVDRATVRRPTARRYRFLGVGAPGPRREQLRGLRRTVSEDPAAGLALLRSLDQQPVGSDELTTLARLFPPDRVELLLGNDAQKPRVLKDLARGADVIAFSTHGFLAREIPGVAGPSLLLRIPEGASSPLDAVLTTEDLGPLSADAELVVLSACNTAGADGRPPTGAFSGLTSGFMRAGAGALLVSHWEVASTAASALTEATLRGARDGALAFSLRSAMRALRDQRAASCDALHAHPFYWAPFVLVGDGARALP